MSFAAFARRFVAEQAAQDVARRVAQQAPTQAPLGSSTPMPPVVPAYQGPIRQDLNIFELTGQTMGAPAAPLSTEAQALAQLANFMALRQQAQGGAVPPVLGPLAEPLPAPSPEVLHAVAALMRERALPFPSAPPPSAETAGPPAPTGATDLRATPRSTYAMPPAADAMAQAIRNQAAVRAAQDTETAIADMRATEAAQTAVVEAATEAVGIAASATAFAAGAEATIMAVVSENAELQAALVGLATSQAESERSVVNAQATSVVLATQVVDLEATINAEPTATATPTPTATSTLEPTATPTPVPTTTPTFTPTPLPEAGDVLYEATGVQLKDWPVTGDWKYAAKMLVSAGTNREASEWLPAPVDLGELSDYALEADVQFVRDAARNDAFGLVVRAGSDGAYWVGINTDCRPRCRARIDAGDSTLSNRLATEVYDPGTDWHTYRVEAQGNVIRLLIDGALVLEAVDNQFLAGEQVGLFSYGTQVNVRSFKVIAL